MPPSLTQAAKKLSNQLNKLSFSDPVTHVYNPTDYAWQAHKEYLERYGSGKKRILFMGMNPGPFGMAQTGIPFGEISMVRDWIGIQQTIGKPKNEHPKRLIEGFACTKSEVSGKRLWGLFSEKYPNAEDFFANHFVHNFCPLVWMGETGKNITPDKLSKTEIAPVETLCSRFVADVITALEPSFLIGVGAYAEKKITQAVKEHLPNSSFTIGKILHPSPASPIANRGWAPQAEKQLIDMQAWS